MLIRSLDNLIYPSKYDWIKLRVRLVIDSTPRDGSIRPNKAARKLARQTVQPSPQGLAQNSTLFIRQKRL